MNERIKELAEQAGIHPSNFEPNADIKVPLEKFAELIVQEAMMLNSKELSITAIERLLPLYEEHFRVEL